MSDQVPVTVKDMMKNTFVLRQRFVPCTIVVSCPDLFCLPVLLDTSNSLASYVPALRPKIVSSSPGPSINPIWHSLFETSLYNFTNAPLWESFHRYCVQWGAFCYDGRVWMHGLELIRSSLNRSKLPCWVLRSGHQSQVLWIIYGHPVVDLERSDVFNTAIKILYMELRCNFRFQMFERSDFQSPPSQTLCLTSPVLWTSFDGVSTTTGQALQWRWIEFIPPTQGVSHIVRDWKEGACCPVHLAVVLILVGLNATVSMDSVLSSLYDTFVRLWSDCICHFFRYSAHALPCWTVPTRTMCRDKLWGYS